MRDAMAEPRAHVLGETGRSDLPGDRRRQFLSFATGILGGAVGGAVGGAAGGTTGAAAGAAGGVIPALFNALTGRWIRPPGLPAAALSHVRAEGSESG
ncbi:hypothetical protein [Flindersiella endophytica]